MFDSEAREVRVGAGIEDAGRDEDLWQGGPDRHNRQPDHHLGSQRSVRDFLAPSMKKSAEVINRPMARSKRNTEVRTRVPCCPMVTTRYE